MKINTEIIIALNPCEDRLDNYLKHYENFNGELHEFFELPEIDYSDKIWVALRLMERESVEVFAVDCAVTSVANAANAAYATYAAYASAANAANAAATAAAANAANAATYAANTAATDAANAAAYAAAVAAANAAAYAANAATNAANAKEDNAERERQLEAILWLTKENKYGY